MRALLVAFVATLTLASPAVAAPTWLPPLDVADGGPATLTGDVAVAPDGTTLVVSEQQVGGFYRVRARVRRPGAGFGQVIDLSPADRNAGSSRVAVDQQGNFTVAFTVDDPTSQVRSARLPAGGNAFEPVEIVSAGSTAIMPEIAVGGNGTAVIAFLQANAIQVATRPGPAGEFGVATTVSGIGPTGYQVAVDDAGNAIAVWSRETAAGTIRVEASERAAHAGFPAPGGARTLSSLNAGHKATDPALAMTPDGRVLVLWTFRVDAGPLSVEEIERQPSGTWDAAPRRASKPGEAAHSPEVAIDAGGSAVAAWRTEVGGTPLLQAAVRPPNGAFAGHRNFSTGVGVLRVVGNRVGDAMVTWNGSMSEGVFAVRRPAGGDFGSVDTVALGTQGSANPAIALNFEDVAIDDLGNATALWRRDFGQSGIFSYTLQTASYDASPPRLDAVSVPSTGTPAGAIGMAATASDRLSVPVITWNFGDGTTAIGPAVSHAYAAAGAYTVTVTATDGAGSTASTTRAVVVAPAIPPEKKRIKSKVKISWGVTSTRTFLIKLKVPKVPKGGKAQLTCKGKKCPFKKVSSKKRRKGTIVLFKNVKLSKVQTMKKRTFRPGQRVELRITAPRYIGKVVRYKLKRDKVPVGKEFCLPVGAKKPRKICN